MAHATSTSRQATSAQSTARAMQRPSSTATATATVPVRLLASATVSRRLLDLVATADVEVLVSVVGGALTVRARLTADDIAAPHFAYGRLSVDWTRGRISGDRGSASVSRTELRLLGVLLDGAGEPIAREPLIRSTWPDAGARQSSSLLAVYIHILRRHLAAVGLAGALETVRGLGYRLRL